MKRGVGAAVLLITMAGCAVGPDFQRPTGPAADRYTAEALASESAHAASGTAQRIALGRGLEGDWWQLFRSDQLDRVVRDAIAGFDHSFRRKVSAPHLPAAMPAP